MNRFSLIKMMSYLIVLFSLFAGHRQVAASTVSLIEHHSDKELIISYDFKPVTNAQPGITVTSDSFILCNQLDRPVKFYIESSLVLEKELRDKIFFSFEKLSASTDMETQEPGDLEEIVINGNGQEVFQFSLLFDGDLLENNSQNKKGKVMIKVFAQEIATGQSVSIDKLGNKVISYSKNLPKTNEDGNPILIFLGMIFILLIIGVIINQKLHFVPDERR